MRLSSQALVNYENQYVEQEAMAQEEQEMLERLPETFADGTWEWEDLEWIVRWKMADLPYDSKVIDDFNSNEKAFVENQISSAVEADAPTEKLDVLTEITGVAERMGTAFLVFMHPDQFSVLDWKAWGALYDSGHLNYEFPEQPDAEDYLIYLGACRALAGEYNVDLRTLDRAIWVIGGEE